jgi:hypothetical protein
MALSAILEFIDDGRKGVKKWSQPSCREKPETWEGQDENPD